ncbi:hypothetical protein [Streptomyces sp. NPDC001135]
MSDQPPPDLLTEAELSARLRGLAARGAAPAPATGAQVRSRAARRRGGRRVLLSTGALAAAALTAVASGALDGSPAEPAPARPAPSPSPVQRVTVDLDSHALVIEGRRFPIASPASFCPIGETTVTVTAKYPVVKVRRSKLSSKLSDYSDSRRWAVTFTDRSHHERLLMFELEPAQATAVGNDQIFGSLALAPKAGKQVYDAIEPGARVEIKGRQAAHPTSESICVDYRPIVADR